MAEELLKTKQNKTDKHITMELMVVGQTYGSSANSSFIMLYALPQDYDQSKCLTKPSGW